LVQDEPANERRLGELGRPACLGFRREAPISALQGNPIATNKSGHRVTGLVFTLDIRTISGLGCGLGAISAHYLFDVKHHSETNGPAGRIEVGLSHAAPPIQVQDLEFIAIFFLDASSASNLSIRLGKSFPFVFATKLQPQKPRHHKSANTKHQTTH